MIKKRRKHKFRLIIRSKYRGWWTTETFSDYDFAARVKRELEKHDYKVISSVI